ncbi:hypothetical protein [Aureimonas sp. AU12]|uniref:hypothetical protein n=1 Tax=Aureimonas sp. AU12 TaxID=1638161 RepID=UPI0007850E6E|nr:hypothetical protein [Aureimonas sp. AU12]
MTFFKFRESGTGKLVVHVFGSGVLLKRRGPILALTALLVAEQFGLGETYMQTHLGAVSLRKAICRLDRAQYAAV